MPGRITWTAGSLVAGIVVGILILLLGSAGLESDREPLADVAAPQTRLTAPPTELQVAPQENGSNDPLANPDPGTPAAQLLADSEPARRSLLRRAIGDAGQPCNEVQSATALDASGSNWRVNCGQSQLYWVGIDNLGRWSVEPGSYSERPNWPTGERTITITPEEVE